MKNPKKFSFIDSCLIKISGGKGGNGSLSFLQQMYLPKGGADGGNGGNGGKVIFIGDHNLNNLAKFRFRKNLVAQNGSNGRNKCKNGKCGDDLVVGVPLGTKIYQCITNNQKSSKLYLGEITSSDQKIIGTAGGQGGRGNKAFVSSYRKAPSLVENGKPGETKSLLLELQMMADVGIVGMPNAGKSTLIRAITNSRAKIASFPFTTLRPNIGVVHGEADESFICADLPGLIPGAAQGKGLGHIFLKHIERCLIIVHLLDVSGQGKGAEIFENYHMLNQELYQYDPNLSKKKVIVVANKIDDQASAKNIKLFLSFFSKLDRPKLISISALKKQNLDTLKTVIFSEIKTIKKQINNQTTEIAVKTETKIIKYRSSEKNKFVITKPKRNWFEVSGPEVEQVVARFSFVSHDNYLKINHTLKKLGVFTALEKKGIKPKDTVKINHILLEWK